MVRRGGRQFLTRVDKPLRHLGKFQPEQGAAGSEHKIKARRHEGLVAAVDLPETALGAVAMDGIADGGPGSNHPDAGRNSRRLSGTHPPSQEEGPAIDAAALLSNGAEVVVASQVLPGAEAHLKQP